MSNEKAVFTLVVPKSRDPKDGNFEIGLKDIDDATFTYAQKLFTAGKLTEAVRFIVKQLRVSGDTYEEYAKSFISVMASQDAIAEIITPLEGSLKKN